MDLHQRPASEDHSSDPGSPPKSPQFRSAPSPDSAQTVISGAFFAGAHAFSINGGSFNNSNGDIHQDIVNDHSYRSNFGNRYGSNRWTQATARAQFHYEQNFAGAGQGGRTSAPPNYRSPIPPIPASEIEQLRMSTALRMDGKGLNTTITLAMDLLANTIRTMPMTRKAMMIRKCTMRNRANHNLVNDKLTMRKQNPNLLALLLRGLASNQTIPLQSCCPPSRW
ncbi:hypothetical protein F5890DRAFT_519746 [Lentinula detonsa]|uniref:Uncharacterized protein n=1 Tax=Lentinula detonsa TaxID=2804962 RepID=A0AA38PTV1_9AGAR|nr:hypothetical protein F5890DRAFT_519746 [Lentinula detonsa]